MVALEEEKEIVQVVLEVTLQYLDVHLKHQVMEHQDLTQEDTSLVAEAEVALETEDLHQEHQEDLEVVETVDL